MKGIGLANDCDLKYKSSKNQRLLIELCLMQLASITFDGEKKNSRHYIIPPSYFKKKGITPVQVTVHKEESKVSSTLEIKTTANAVEVAQVKISESKTVSEVKDHPKITLNKEIKRTSGLSLSSIKGKKEHLIRQMDVIIDEENLPKEPFTEDALKETWITYVKNLEDQGKHNLASILSIDTPKLIDTTIHLEFPNATNKVELERNQFDLLSFIRKTLNNFDINLSITVNEEIEKQYAYTPFEKFEKLKEKNKNIDVLRKTFDLDI